MTCLTFEEYQKKEGARQELAKKNSDALAEEIRTVRAQQEEYVASMMAKLDAFDEACAELDRQNSIQTAAQRVQELNDRLNRLQDVERYLSALVTLERIKERIAKHIERGELDGGIETLKELKKAVNESTLLDFDLVNRHAHALDQWACGLVEAHLKERFGEQLSKLEWPKPIEVGKWKGLEMELLLKTLDSYLIFSSICGDSNIALRATTVLVEPIKVRFLFHFATDRPTNRLDKPEWFLSHLAQAITAHLPVVENCFELEVEGSDSVVNTFVNLLCDLGRRHLMKRCPQILADPFLLVHTVSEVCSFVATVRESSGVDCSRILSEFFEATFEEWIAAQKEATTTTLQAILHDSPSWADLSLEGPPHNPSLSPMIREFVALVDDLMRTLLCIPSTARMITFIGEVLMPLFNTLYASIDYDIPAFYSNVEDVRILILMGNSLHELNGKIENEWGGSLEAVEIGESGEFAGTFGYAATGLPGSIFNKVLVAFRGLHTRVIDGIHSFLWQSFSSPASSFIKSMHYGVLRERTIISMHDDLRKALVAIAESFGRVKPYLHSTGMDLVEAQFIDSLDSLLFDRLILQNFFRPESVPQLQEDLETMRRTFVRLMPGQPVGLALERSREAATLLGMGEAEHEHLREALRMEDLDETANVLGALKINRLSVGECEKVLSLVRF